jgi:homoserine kinase type II
MTDLVALLYHVRELGDAEEVKLIGVYRSEDEAWLARDRVAGAPGFVDFPDGFEVDTYVIGVDHWAEGFVVDL